MAEQQKKLLIELNIFINLICIMTNVNRYFCNNFLTIQIVNLLNRQSFTYHQNPCRTISSVIQLTFHQQFDGKVGLHIKRLAKTEFT